MPRKGVKADKNMENAVRIILKSRSKTKIYLYLLKKDGAKTEQIVSGTKLHPSTVRETLSKMNTQKLIIRKKQRNDSIGKNPYLYYAIPPVDLLKRYKREMEEGLNKLASFAFSNKNDDFKSVKIKIYDKAEQA